MNETKMAKKTKSIKYKHLKKGFVLKQTIRFALFGFVTLLLSSCGASNPVEKMQRELNEYPEYSIILEDMKMEGTFFKDYFHQYKIIHAEKAGDSLAYFTNQTEWLLVDEDFFSNYQRYLGMTIASKSAEGDVSDSPQPPGYQYVGDERYGQWRTDNSGGSFWEFYGKYAMLQALLGGWNRPIYQDDWRDYRTSRRNNQPYFGKNRQWGTDGTATKKTNPTFFQRRQMREQASKQSFTDKLKQRTRRSNMSKSRSRSGGFGK